MKITDDTVVTGGIETYPPQNVLAKECGCLAVYSSGCALMRGTIIRDGACSCPCHPKFGAVAK